MKAFKNAKEENRISLLYELNEDSAIFARIAELEYENENYNKALEILDKGLDLYPDYAAAYFLKAKTLAKLGNSEQAEEMITAGNELLDFEDTGHAYSKIIYDMDSDNDLSSTRMNVFVPSSISNTDEEETKDTDDFKIDDTFGRDFDDLDKLEMELNDAKMPPLADDFSEFELLQTPDEKTEIITETMANIYLEQGKVREAISTFEKLAETKPEQADYFLQKAQDIKNSHNL